MREKLSSLTENELKITVGINVKKYREFKNLTQEQLAEKLKLSTVFISRLENGVYGLKYSTIVLISNVLEIEPYQLFIPQKKN